MIASLPESPGALFKALDCLDEALETACQFPQGCKPHPSPLHPSARFCRGLPGMTPTVFTWPPHPPPLTPRWEQASPSWSCCNATTYAPSQSSHPIPGFWPVCTQSLVGKGTMRGLIGHTCPLSQFWRGPTLGKSLLLLRKFTVYLYVLSTVLYAC